ncbi:MAG: hypothetical protein ACIAXF_06215 [Phycisphaerales bacterium JB063]
MVEGHRREAWSHTASLMALTANLHRPKGKRAFKVKDFDPTQQKPKAKQTTDLSMLKAYLTQTKRNTP